MGVSGGDPVAVAAWLTDLTFAEVHAFTFGVGHGLAIAATYFMGLQMAAQGLAVAALALLGYVRTDRTEDRLPGRVLGAIPATLRGQIRAESHYYIGGLVIAAVLTASAFVAVNYL